MKKLLSMIKDKSYLLVCDDNDAIKYLIKKCNKYFNNKLVDISYITFNELVSKLNFVKNDEIILTIMDAFGLSYDIASLYIDNILQTNYLIEQKCDIDKVVQIYEIKKFLIENNLYKKDNLINHYLSNKEVIIYSKEFDEYKKYLLKDINYTFVSLINENIFNNKVDTDIFRFKTIDEEIAYICENIIKKLNLGVDKKDIYVVCESNDYLYTLKRIAKYFNLDFNIKENVSLMNIKFVRDIVNKYFDNTFSEIDESMLNKEELSLYKQVVTIINKYVKYSDKVCYKTFLLNKLQIATKKREKNKNAINVISLNEAYYLSKIDENAYIYVLGMYQGNSPKIKKDEEYYSDMIKKKYNIHDSSKINLFNQIILKELISNSNNITLTFSHHSNFNEYIISSIVNIMNVNVIDKSFYISSYSNIYNKEVFYKKYDTFSKYGTSDKTLGDLYNTYNDDLYGSYNNDFSGLDNNKVLDLLGNKLKLSYTTMDEYNKCAFAYYLKHVLKINDFKGNFSLFIGNIYHYVIEKHFKNDNFDFDNEYKYIFEKESETYLLTPCESILMKKLKEELKDVIRYLDYQLNYINYNESEYERYVKIESDLYCDDRIVNIKFDGKIDKMLYKNIETEDGNKVTLVAIVDYKTSTNIKFQIELVAYGLSLQLPVYAFLVNNINEIDNVVVGALFIQPLISSKLIESQSCKEKYLKKKDDLRRMQGYYNFELDGENAFADKNIITSSKGISNGEIAGLVETVKYHVDTTFNDISRAKFDVNPKRVDGKEYSCAYCDFADICYRKEANFINITTNKEEHDA